MLSKTQMVKVRKAVELLYNGTCTVTAYQEYVKPNKSTGHREVVVLNDQPCRIVYTSAPAVAGTETGTAAAQQIKLFIAPELEIKAGSKIAVTQNGVTKDYCCSGIPAVYMSHQEINLEVWKGWA